MHDCSSVGVVHPIKTKGKLLEKRESVNHIMQTLNLHHQRVVEPGQYFNFSYKYDGPLKRDKHMFLCEYPPLRVRQERISHSARLCVVGDSGLAFNLPFPPLLRKEREVNCCIVLHSHSFYVTFVLALPISCPLQPSSPRVGGHHHCVGCFQKPQDRQRTCHQRRN